MKKAVSCGLLAVVALSLAACGGGGGAGSGTGAGGTVGSTGGGGGGSTTPGVAGQYTGAYKTNVITSSTPYALYLTQNGSTVSGRFVSTKITGQVGGSVANDGTLTLIVSEPVGLGTIYVSMAPTGSGTWTLATISGSDVFGTHTSGSGTLAPMVSTPSTTFASGYNGYANFLNNSATSTAPVPFPSGMYPMSITNIASDGSGYGWSGTMYNAFFSGILSLSYITSGSIYTGQIYPGGGAYRWVMGNGGFFLSDIASNLYFYRLDPSMTYIDTSSVRLWPGDLTQDIPGTWSYTNPNQSAVGILSASVTYGPTNGSIYTAQVSVSLRQTAGGAVDTVTGLVSGFYDLSPATTSHAVGRTFQFKMAPPDAQSLTITNNSGLTTGFSLYMNFMNSSTSPKQLDLVFDSGNKAWADTVLTK